jgi:DDE superfamily endonuclease
LKPHLRKCWVIPPEQSGEFVAHMEDVLDLYHLPYNPTLPLVCMDEQPVQLVKETRRPLPAAPGKPEKVDYEYERNGTANIFMFTEPLNGTRHVHVTEHRTAVDWAHEIRDLLEVDYPTAERVRLVCDNLNTHGIGSLYEAFPPEQARELVTRLELHHTPKHGSWLNIAEIELSALTGQCLDRRIPDIETLHNETRAWEQRRNARHKGVDWQFTTQNARIKLKRLYPQIHE